MKILVTGAAGLYGVHLVDLLVKDKGISKVYAVDNFSRGFLQKDPFIISKNFTKKVDVLKRNYQDITAKEFDRWGVDVVVHLAAYVSIPQSMDSPDAYFINNEYGTFKLIHTLYGTRGKPLIIYASSPEVYGSPKYLPMDVNHPTDPRSVYAVTKLAAEKHLRAMHDWYGYPLIIIRNFNTYGENQEIWRYTAVVPEFIRRALKNEPIIIHNDGKQTRDFQYVKDAVSAYHLACKRHKDLNGIILNIGTGSETQIKDLAYMVVKLADSMSKIIYEPGRKADLFALSADISLTTKRIGWQPEYSLEEGLKRTIEWYRKVLK
mgnify:CR=1 FL=1